MNANDKIFIEQDFSLNDKAKVNDKIFMQQNFSLNNKANASDNFFMQQALLEARKAFSRGDVPVGA